MSAVLKANAQRKTDLNSTQLNWTGSFSSAEFVSAYHRDGRTDGQTDRQNYRSTHCCCACVARNTNEFISASIIASNLTCI